MQVIDKIIVDKVDEYAREEETESRYTDVKV
jgi:hypothetical protein